MDRFISSLTGRPCSLNDEEYVFFDSFFGFSRSLISDSCSFDLDLPIECDDEYWDNGFQQPSGKPSSITYFNCFLRLMDIFAYAMRLIVRQIYLGLFFFRITHSSSAVPDKAPEWQDCEYSSTF